ncbi:hypothetical protein [Niabella hibiscisoli]|uniref:hypothetical protein n=1 Tax=Niabella hibiscisoli TaxID=1825928 RepID=UPI001F0D4195|nr:hypothetical protein [Niabella hibiscisoli]MCH5716676.1 hypothetical protein [Niabella hibiscisoli]
MELPFFNFIDTLDDDERSILKTALSQKIDRYFDSNNHLQINSEDERNQFDQLAMSLKRLSVHSNIIPADGILYQGFPAWLNEELLQKVITEGEGRRLEPLEQIDHFLGCGGLIADELSVSAELLMFIQNLVPVVVSPTGIASYIYYDQEGAGIRPHVDTDVFSLNLILMLKHEVSSSYMPSATIVFPAFMEPQSFRLKVGEVLIMYGGNVIHTRSRIAPGEIVHLLTIGFNLNMKSA